MTFFTKTNQDPRIAAGLMSAPVSSRPAPMSTPPALPPSSTTATSSSAAQAVGTSLSSPTTSILPDDLTIATDSSAPAPPSHSHTPWPVSSQFPGSTLPDNSTATPSLSMATAQSVGGSRSDLSSSSASGTNPAIPSPQRGIESTNNAQVPHLRDASKDVVFGKVSRLFRIVSRSQQYVTSSAVATLSARPGFLSIMTVILGFALSI